MAKPKSKASAKAKTVRANRMQGVVDVDVKIDRALKRAWDDAVHRLAEAKREGASAFDEQWETIGAIIEHEPPLYLAGGFATAKQFLQEHVGETERTALRMIRVAKYASPAEEAKYGVSKLDALIAYIETKAGGETKGPIPVDFGKLRVPINRNGSAVSRISVEDASVDEIRAATRKLGRGTTKPKVSPIAVAIAKVLTTAPLKGVKVQVSAGKVSLSAIPIESFVSAIKALTRVKLPKSES